jgi:hypothetical protein
MTTSTSPSEPRKTLARQLDRLEALLDSLGKNLQKEVAAAVEHRVAAAMQQAVNHALQETVLPALHHCPTTRAPAAASAREAGRATCQRLGLWIKDMVRHLRTAFDKCLGQTARRSPWLAVAGTQLWRRKCRLLWACSMSLAVSFVIGWAGPWLGVSVGFLAGFLLTLALQARQRLPLLLSMPIDSD